MVAQRALFLTDLQPAPLLTVLPAHYVLREVWQRVPLVRRPLSILAVVLVQKNYLVLHYQVFYVGLHLTLALLVEESNHVGNL